MNIQLWNNCFQTIKELDLFYNKKMEICTTTQYNKQSMNIMQNPECIMQNKKQIKPMGLNQPQNNDNKNDSNYEQYNPENGQDYQKDSHNNQQNYKKDDYDNAQGYQEDVNNSFILIKDFQKIVEMEKQQVHIHNHVKLGIIGNVDSGKSTLVGVLTKGIKDDGNGSARLRVMNYKHQHDTGRTSSIGQQIMGFDKNGIQIVPQRFNQNKNKYWKEVVENSYKIVSLVDLCGHEKYLKTTINGLTGLSPEFGCVVIGANMGIQKMTKQHIGLCLFLKIPFFVALTKIDLAPQNKLDETLDQIKKLMKAKILNRMPILMKQDMPENELQKTIQLLGSNSICPIFQISSVSGVGINQLIHFVSRLQIPKLDFQKTKNETFQFEINQTFIVEGVGLVVSGIVRSGIGKMNLHCFLGPDKVKNFKHVTIKSIHVNRVLQQQTYPGQLACLCIKSLKAGQKLIRKQVRKGMVIIDGDNKPEPVIQFEAEMQVLHHSTTIGVGYEGVMHCGTIQQTTTIKQIYEQQVLRNQDRGRVRLRFKYRPQFVKVGETILLRQGKTKIIGTISKIIQN